MRKAIVVGGAGFVGTNLIKKLLKEDWSVVSIDNYSTGTRDNEQPGCKYYDFDITDYPTHESRPEELADIVKDSDVIFHLAALARIQPSLVKPSNTLQANVMGTVFVLDLAREFGIPVVYAGSSSFHHGLYGSPYAWSKHAGEQLCKLYSEVFDMNTSIFRFYNVYGDHQLESGEYATVLGIFEKQMRDGKNLTITGDGEQRRDFTHVDDIVNGLYLAVGRDFKADIFELGSGKNYSINEVAKLFEHPYEYIPARKGEYPYTLCDHSKATDVLGWKPEGNLENWIKGRK